METLQPRVGYTILCAPLSGYNSCGSASFGRISETSVEATSLLEVVAVTMAASAQKVTREAHGFVPCVNK